MAEKKIIYWAENQVEADLMCGMFQEYGIPAVQWKESIGKSLGLQFGALGSIAIAVDEDREAEAEALILSMDEQEGEEDDQEGQDA